MSTGGGIAGCGGNISVSAKANIKAVNGNRYTVESYGFEACPIRGQTPQLLEDLYILKGGYTSKVKSDYLTTKYKTDASMDKYTYFYNIAKKYIPWTTETLIATDNYSSNYSGISEYKITANELKKYVVGTSYGQGIGTGAGYIEWSNGIYTRYNEDVNGNFTTVYTGE